MRNEQAGGGTGFTSSPAAAHPARWISLDAWRGVIVVLMALDHANHFIAHKHSSGEYWGGYFPIYRETLPFLTRLVTHPVAPGFSFLMGIGVALFAQSRIKSGWTRRRISLHLGLRGLLLIFLQLAVVNRAWELSPQGWRLEFYFGVLIALGGGLILGGLFVWLPILPLLGLGLFVFIAVELLTPSPENWGLPFSFPVRILLVPGGQNAWWVNYPVLQWVELVIFGIGFGKKLLENPQKQLGNAWIIGLGLLGIFVPLRMLNGFGNIRPMSGDSWIDFLNLVKYPPSMTFTLLTMGINLLLLSLLAAISEPRHRIMNIMAVLGRVPLFFYVTHLFIYAVLGNLFAPRGMSIPAMIPFWLVGLVLLYPICRWYGRFKSRQPPGSLVRFF